MIGEEQSKEIDLKKLQTIKCFLLHPECGNRELSELLYTEYNTHISKSSVDRYLSEANKDFIIRNFDEKTYNYIRDQRKINKETGPQKGGLTSQELYGYSKDDIGHFKGRGR